MAAGLSTAPAAHASDFGVELNGTYRVTTNGELAKTNDVFKDVPTIVETWTIVLELRQPDRMRQAR